MRKRGTAIVETEKGIILTSQKGKTFLLPGGGANKGESRFRAAIRELEEETGLVASEAKVLFRHKSKHHEHTVTLVKAGGKPKPNKEVRFIDYYPRRKIGLSRGTKQILKKYFEWKKNN